MDDPPFDNSAMDGWAVIHADTLSASRQDPVQLQVVGMVQATATSQLPIMEKGQAIRIMTGAPIPQGADSILQVELSKYDEESNIVTLFEESKPHFIRRQGENLRFGDNALLKGELLSAETISLCATMGHPKISVLKKLKVAIISTGDELAQPGTELKHGELYESNSFGLAGLVRWLGHTPIRKQAAGDNLNDLRNHLDEAAAEADIILTSGGVSMGEYDLVRKLMEEEGEIHFWRVKLRPGSPPLFGTWKGKPIWGLPGNPVSSQVVFRVLVAPWIRHHTSATGPIEQRVMVKLLDKVKPLKDGLTLRRILVENTPEGFVGRVATHQGSANLNSLVISNALTLLSPGDTGEVGEWVEAMLY